MTRTALAVFLVFFLVLWGISLRLPRGEHSFDPIIEPFSVAMAMAATAVLLILLATM